MLPYGSIRPAYFKTWKQNTPEEGPCSRCYRRTAALRLLVQPCDEDYDDDDDDYFLSFS
jgi:hypothetical protein